MTDKEALLALNLIGNIGSRRLQGLLRCFGSASRIFSARRQELVRACGIGENIASRIASFNSEALSREFSLAKSHGLSIITQSERDYPENLKNIPDPPLVLYVRGSLSRDDNLAFAIVGSRLASVYGLTNSEHLAGELACLGFTVVSGMARGIDTAAHRGALRAGGRTIAVIGSGFNHIYPRENKGLAERISENGAVISEFPIDTVPLKQNFPRRNRVISGLSLGVLVAEAALNSGALITADFALEQGREVFALPGKIDAMTSSGTNGLIKQGAKLVSGIEDILEELKSPLMARVCRRQKEGSPEINRDSVDREEALLYNLIPKDPVSLDDIIEKSSFGIPRLSALLLSLEFKRLIRELPGKNFVRA
ncbi:MAG: DNA-processing protein DprA [Candidatus Omnitrophota bacterium]